MNELKNWRAGRNRHFVKSLFLSVTAGRATSAILNVGTRQTFGTQKIFTFPIRIQTVISIFWRGTNEPKKKSEAPGEGRASEAERGLAVLPGCV